MTDEELISRLMSYSSDEAMWSKEAAARINELLKEAVLNKASYDGVSSLLLSVQQDCISEHLRAEAAEAKLARAVEALRELEEGGKDSMFWTKDGKVSEVRYFVSKLLKEITTK